MKLSDVSMNLPAILPESFLRCLSPADRKQLAGGQRSAEEVASRAVIKSERQLQGMIVNLLRLKGIEPLWQATYKKATASKGMPDILFAVRSAPIIDWVFPCGWEIKFGDGQLSKEQQQMHIRLSTPPNSWRIKVIRSVDEALAELKELGIK